MLVQPAQRNLPALLAIQLEAHGDRPLVRVGELERTVSETYEIATGFAAVLAAAGVDANDRVAVMSENRIEIIDAWLGCAWLGAVLVPVNPALRGRQLGHVLADSGARLLLIEEALLDTLDFVDERLPALERIWVFGEPGGSRLGRSTEIVPAPEGEIALEDLRAGDTSMILYTSGTTGPSKGVLCPHAQWYWWGVKTGEILGIDRDDVLYTCLPLSHANALNTFVQALLWGATFALGPRFSASAFWTRIVEADATVTYLLGAMVHILAKGGSDPSERAHRVRVALAPATAGPLHAVFRKRFGIRLIDGWGSTETNFVLSAAMPGAPPGSMGAVTPGFAARVVDRDDEEVPEGVAGELVVRSDEPFAFATGYHGLPEHTTDAWRNLWFHTGDRVVRDEQGWFWFRDRIKDSIRRRGENVSSHEVEAVLVDHPDVETAAVVPVPAEVGEDDILAFVTVRSGAHVEPGELIDFCLPRLARFAVPRYLEVLEELPMTANGKVEKFRLRDRGVTATTWDRESDTQRTAGTPRPK
jgi:crotonobetaine/carnitine-CoA ligase